jgi:hypothetical protein
MCANPLDSPHALRAPKRMKIGFSSPIEKGGRGDFRIGSTSIMAMPFHRGRSPGSGDRFRRLLTRAEAVTLLGMILCISSLFLAWPVPYAGKLISPALVINLTLNGSSMPDVRWPVTVGAILSGLLLAVEHSKSSRMPLAFVQALCGLVCFIIALMHFGILPGPLVDLLGGALLTFGAVDGLGQSASGGHRTRG